MRTITDLIIKVALILCLSCSNNQESTTDERLADFDHWALKHLKMPINFKGLPPRDSCTFARLLTRVVPDTLVDLTAKLPLVVVGPYFVRNYYVDGMSAECSLVKDGSDTVHFVHHADMERFNYGGQDYQIVTDVKSKMMLGRRPLGARWLRLRDSVTVVRFNTAVLDFLLRDPNFRSLYGSDGSVDYDNAKFFFTLIEEIYQTPHQPVGLEEVVLYLASVKNNVSKKCIRKIDSLRRSEYNSRTYEIPYTGFLIVSLPTTAGIEIDFVPYYDRPFAWRTDIPGTYRDCDRLAK